MLSLPAPHSLSSKFIKEKGVLRRNFERLLIGSRGKTGQALGAYGLTPPTARYWAQQFGLGYGVIAVSSYLLLILLTVLALDTWI